MTRHPDRVCVVTYTLALIGGALFWYAVGDALNHWIGGR